VVQHKEADEKSEMGQVRAARLKYKCTGVRIGQSWIEVIEQTFFFKTFSQIDVLVCSKMICDDTRDAIPFFFPRPSGGVYSPCGCCLLPALCYQLLKFA
jgi:hypothetical protein